MADVEMKNASDKKTKEPHRPRNYKLPGGIWRFTRSRMYHKRGMWNVKRETTKKEKPKRKPRTIVKPIGGEKNGGKRVVKLKKQVRWSKEYTVNEKRKKDQIEVDRQLIEAIKKHPEKKMMFSYLASVFQLRNKMYPHRMKF
ncbi:60S ribosomal protein L6-like [Centruroides sculpturatus]|uniref:60S ribosomal protein L6-like n=1 Tax=Centruroides sculpturatus TaxID=218467 RepID=UPI000C6EE10E|nr:60S ribosomal protein L6-like [Centruroides sculpturatus]